MKTATEEGGRSRLELALRVCCQPQKTVRFYADNAQRAKAMFERACQLIPRQFVKRYGLQTIIFSNDSRIEFTTPAVETTEDSAVNET